MAVLEARVSEHHCMRRMYSLFSIICSNARLLIRNWIALVTEIVCFSFILLFFACVTIREWLQKCCEEFPLVFIVPVGILGISKSQSTSGFSTLGAIVAAAARLNTWREKQNDLTSPAYFVLGQL